MVTFLGNSNSMKQPLLIIKEILQQQQKIPTNLDQFQSQVNIRKVIYYQITYFLNNIKYSQVYYFYQKFFYQMFWGGRQHITYKKMRIFKYHYCHSFLNSFSSINLPFFQYLNIFYQIKVRQSFCNAFVVQQLVMVFRSQQQICDVYIYHISHFKKNILKQPILQNQNKNINNTILLTICPSLTIIFLRAEAYYILCNPQVFLDQLKYLQHNLLQKIKLLSIEYLTNFSSRKSNF
eukprot:TRINITY_DN64223_c0_g1_i5.p1 TRINITY_DN64223_c0_g1~~TRINITY_DN64223_c0_g1_i5.p1  ORF type:complete len:235 (-),score=-25.86 TRINITY_DN64223_c0_g1_i5:325-1029(-)